MALDFPSSPTNGQTYTYSSTTWTYDSTAGVWNITGTGFLANSSYGTAGQVLTSNGSTTYWSTPAAGGGGGASTGTAIAMAMIFGG